MRNIIKNLILTMVPVLLLLSNSSCEKWRNNRETYTSENHTLAESSFLYIMHNILIAATNEGQLLKDSCFQISVSGSGFPQTVMLNFGNEGCEGLFFVPATGILTAQISDSVSKAGAVITVSPTDLYVNGFRVEGLTTITHEGNGKYKLKVTDGVVTAGIDEKGDAIVLSWECDYGLELLEKNNADLSFDDLYQITGTAAGINEEGRDYTAEITTPLQKYVDCRWPGSGVTKISPVDLRERDLFYGNTCLLHNTCCDNVAEEQARGLDRAVRMQ